MADNKTPKSEVINVPSVRLAFAELDVPKQVQGQGKPSYGCTLIVDPANEALVKALDVAMLKTAIAKWGQAEGATTFKALMAKDRTAFKHGPRTDGSGMPYQGFDGMYSLSTRAQAAQKPLVLDRNRQPGSVEQGTVYSGCYVNARVAFWAQDNKFGRRINCQILGVQFVKDGDSFGGGMRASVDDFDDLGDSADDLDMSDLLGETA